MRYFSYLNTAKEIIAGYGGSEPLASFLKKKFAGNKKYGSSDRKWISALCYNYFRSGKALQQISLEERILAGFFLTQTSASPFLQCTKPEWNELAAEPYEEKARLADIDLTDIFPFFDELSEGVDQPALCISFLQQPDLFLRIRPGKREQVIGKLQEGGIKFEIKGNACLAIPNSTRLEDLITQDEEAVVQDLNSQKVLDKVKEQMDKLQLASGKWQANNIHHPISIWDCCAASGGKSILAYDLLNGNVELTVTDIRQRILQNLDLRFKKAGISAYKSVTADLVNGDFVPSDLNYQLIICDAPCSGSGTWGRTPEQLYFFNPEMIVGFAKKQKKILSNTTRYLKEGGLFCYITCSVFKAENEEIAGYIQQQLGLKLISMELLKGYNDRADTMFTAIFTR